METGRLPPLNSIVAGLAKAVGVLFHSADGWKAKRLSAGLIAMLLIANGLTRRAGRLPKAPRGETIAIRRTPDL